MSDTTPSHVPATCPACSPEHETAHEVLSPGGQPTVRCTDCDHVHKTTIEREPTIECDVIVSQDGESFHTRVEAPPTETIAVGEEFVVDSEMALMTVRITSLELPDGREEEARADAVSTIWTRAVDNVSVNVTVNPNDGRHEDTRSFEVLVPGDEEFAVGSTRSMADEEFTIKSIKLRDDTTGYDHEQLDFSGDSAYAKDVLRIYADDETSSAWSAW
ncbi:HVO_0476 family zinc finger protein [Halocatena halophila]|uniref:HVO_0476 family zinc finger protein n=1 Tax=Halocatena halophila TaxID=2814576 RepID=UPI002ED144BF